MSTYNYNTVKHLDLSPTTGLCLKLSTTSISAARIPSEWRCDTTVERFHREVTEEQGGQGGQPVFVGQDVFDCWSW